LQFQKLPLSYFRNHELRIFDQTYFYSCLEHKRVFRFERLQYRDSQTYSENWSFTDREWAQVGTDPSQCILLIARTVFLIVDTETDEEGNSAFPHDPHLYSVRSGLLRVGCIYLRPSWRRKQPTDLEFVSITDSLFGESLVLIQRRGPVAYRVQMIEQRTAWPCTRSSSRKRIILG
jgi:hypothetical protein